MSTPRLLSRLANIWRRQSLTRRFLLASASIFLLGMAITGAWIAERIEEGVSQNTAAATALYFESFVAPLVRDLAHQDPIPADKQAVLGKLISNTVLGQRVISFKIWIRGGIIVYATRAELIGRRFPPTPKLRQAWAGRVAADFDNLTEEENVGERARGVPLLEIYAPIRQEHSDRIIAVAEFYERADELKRDIFNAKLEAWLIVGGIALCAVAALFGIVGGASRTIERQIAALRTLLAQNEELRARVERSSQRASEVNERYLRRLGAELHDGPAQLIGLALLRLDSVNPKSSPAPTQRDGTGASTTNAEVVRSALREALDEIRNISTGLSVPSLEQLSLSETLHAAVRDHVRRTNTAVHDDIADAAVNSVHSVKTAAFRFVQEALNNATRHAGAVGQSVCARYENGFVTIEVSDQGSGFDPSVKTSEGKLGLIGMRERIESVGGEFSIHSMAGGGTNLMARLPLTPGGAIAPA